MTSFVTRQVLTKFLTTINPGNKLNIIGNNCQNFLPDKITIKAKQVSMRTHLKDNHWGFIAPTIGVL